MLIECQYMSNICQTQMKGKWNNGTNKRNKQYFSLLHSFLPESARMNRNPQELQYIFQLICSIFTSHHISDSSNFNIFHCYWYTIISIYWLQKEWKYKEKVKFEITGSWNAQVWEAMDGEGDGGPKHKDHAYGTWHSCWRLGEMNDTPTGASLSCQKGGVR